MTSPTHMRHTHGPRTGTATRKPRVRRLGSGIAGALAALLLLGPLAAWAQSPATEAQKRDEVRRKKATVAAGINALTASDEELESSVITLTENLKAQQARARDASRAADDAKRHVAEIEASVERTQHEVDALTQQMRSRAIEVYVRPNGKLDQADEALHTADFTSAERKAELLDAATGHDEDVSDLLRAAKSRLETERNDAAVAQQEALLRQAEADAQVRQVQVAKEEQERLKAALDARIRDLQSEAASLNAEDARLTALIVAAHEAEALAAAAAAAPPPIAAVGPTTSAAPGSPTTTSAGGSSTTRPGNGSPSTTAAPPPASPIGKLSWPVSGTVTSGFGSRWGAFHAGIDIATPAGTPIYAAAGGSVISASANSGGYGNLVLVSHGSGMVTAYAHQSKMAVTAGQSVTRGQLLGYVGCTGSCTGDHLHFEVRINGSAQNPMNYL